MEDPDRGWKPNGRPQSTVARNFLSELDDLFKIDSSIDVLDKTVHQKKQAVTSRAQELEALEARLRETEERLKQARSSPPSYTRKDSERQSPFQSTLPEQDKAHVEEPSSPLVQAQTRQKQKPSVETQPAKDMPDRPHTAQNE